MSCWKNAEVAAKIAVRLPIIRHSVRKEVSGSIREVTRISRKTPATTIVDLCNRAETGVGPSMAAGSHGWSPNWADFPTAASRQANKTMFVSHLSDSIGRKLLRFHESFKNRAMLINKMIPMSPMRLYITACNAEALASWRVYHHPISRKERNPTPSHPIKNRKRFLEEVRTNILKRNIMRSRKNFDPRGSDFI